MSTQEILRLTEENERLRYALVKIRAHTVYANPTLELLQGLLQSVERIADAALNSPAIGGEK